jgi:hypothetical protein
MFKTATKAAPAKAAATKKAFGTTKKAASNGSRRPSRNDDEGDGADDDSITSGWGGAKKMQAEHSDYAQRFNMKEETKVIRFLDDEPYANIATHWVKRNGRNSFICLGARTCPMCAVGDKPRVSYCFNIIELTDGEPLHWSWETGIRVERQIEKKAQSTRYGPLSSHFYTVERVGLKKDDTVYTLNVVKREGDIEEEFPELAIPSTADIKKVKGYTKADANKGKPTLKEMQELAAEVTHDDDDDADEDDD